VSENIKNISKYKIVQSTKTRWVKLKQFPVITIDPISINSVSNSTYKLHFHYQEANSYSKYKSCQNVKKDS